ncbi:LysR family transcriptional regulator [Ramlibacter sp. RBP-2]|uniref:LysR family transcriptional regulator n=1 Tax=Ramlibacter lithotrophicus TaxID=2606681 RepID=A0A7X6DJT5_9BURK|nr:LysR family transcriptional regulator [Ramlibacter lithotrophicus]NKE68480.1 LysR family transcriptional regulator [Ramlibacter lithotrophicus]
MHYDLTDLRLFVHVGELLNLTRAAEKSFLSVPSASLRIKQLEESLQAPLLIRHAKGLQLTQAGETLLRHARVVLRQLEVLHADLRPYAKGIKGRIRLQANSTATNTFLADALSAFLNDNPDIDIELEEQPSREIISAVAKGIADLGIVAGTVAADELDVLPLYADELVVISHPHDPITRHTSLRLADMLDTCRFVGLNQFNSIQVFLDRIAHGLGKRVNLRIQVGSYDAVCRMVEAGAGVAVVPRAFAPGYAGHDNLRFLPLQDSWARREISLVRQHQRLLPTFSEALIQHLVDAAAQQRGKSPAR